MIYFINNGFSTDPSLFTVQLIHKIFNGKYDDTNVLETIEKVGNHMTATEIEYDLTQGDFFNGLTHLDYKNQDVIVFCNYSKLAIPHIRSKFGVAYTTFYNIVRNPRNLYQVFNPKMYQKGNQPYHTIMCCFEMISNAYELIDLTQTFYFDDIITNGLDILEVKVNDVSGYERHKAMWNEGKKNWELVKDDEMSTEEAFGKL